MNTEVSLDKFPKLFTISNERLHNYFKERIVYFFFNLTRKNKRPLYELHLEFNDTLIILKNTLSNNYDEQWVIYLDLFFCLIGQTRDIINGKGERDAAYMLIYTFYNYYPTLAIHALYSFVVPIGKNSNNICYGSWKDIPFFCEFIRTFTNTFEHPIIECCIEMLNNQLIKDENNLLINNTNISNVAKWIPREKKKLDWLFDRLVIDWTNKRHPSILKYWKNNYQYYSALTKCKQLYRRTNSHINKYINTTEIKLCSKDFDNIIPPNVPIQHLCKYFDYYCSNNYNKSINSEIFQQYLISNTQFNNKSFNNYSHNYFPITHIIKKAIFYANSSTNIINKHHKEIKILNSLWSKFIHFISIGNLGHIIPFIDVSFNIFNDNQESYYTSIALAIIISQKSLCKNRIIIMGTTPRWVNLNNELNLVSIVKLINDTTFSIKNTKCNFNNAIQLFRDDLFNSYDNCNNFTVVIISNFYNEYYNDSLYTTLSSYFHSNYIPFFIFWNLSNKFNCVIPLHKDNDKIAFLSGYSNNLLTYLEHLKSLHDSHTSYHLITRILFSPRYFYLSNYLRNILK